MAPLSSVRRPVGWGLTALLSLLFGSSAAMKLASATAVVEMFGKWGLGDFRTLIGGGELISALLLLMPRTFSLGVLMLSAYMGGAIVTHMQHGEPFVSQSVILAVIWLTAYLREPAMFRSFQGTASVPTSEG